MSPLLEQIGKMGFRDGRVRLSTGENFEARELLARRASNSVLRRVSRKSRNQVQGVHAGPEGRDLKPVLTVVIDSTWTSYRGHGPTNHRKGVPVRTGGIIRGVVDLGGLTGTVSVAGGT